MALYDENGDLVEDAASKSDLDKLKEEYEAKLKEKDEALAKTGGKEANFKGLRQKTEEEKKALMAKASEEVKILQEQIEALRKQGEAPVTKKREELIKTYGTTPEQEKEVRGELERIETAYGKPTTESELADRLTSTMAVINARKSKQNSLNNFAPSGDLTDYYGSKKPVNYADTDEGKEFADKFMGGLDK